MDDDVEQMDLEASRAEVIRLRNLIRRHMKERGHDRCWLDDQSLYKEALPEGCTATFTLPDWPEFTQECRRYWENRQPHDTQKGCHHGEDQNIGREDNKDA